MRKLQSQGVHHISIVGADRQTSIDFSSESHLYFDPRHGRVIHLAGAIETLVRQSRASVSEDRSPKDPYD